MKFLVFCRPKKAQIDTYTQPYPYKIWCPKCQDHDRLHSITKLRTYHKQNKREASNRFKILWKHFVVTTHQKALLEELSELGYRIEEGCS